MGAWGDANERRSDRMPKLRVQVAESQSQTQNTDMESFIRDAMMNDLGLGRVEDLPLDNTHRERHIPQRARNAPVIDQPSEALSGYLAMAKNGLDDDEAMGVRGLDDLGGPCVYRPPAGPARDFTETRRPNQNVLRGMQVSSNGIVLRPGAELRVYQPTRANSQGEVRIIHPMRSTQRTAAPQPAITPFPQATQATQASVQTEQNRPQQFSKSLPPHLMRKRTTEVSSPAGLAPKVQKTQNDSPVPVEAQEKQTSGKDVASHVTGGLSEDSVVQPQPVVAKLATSEDETPRDRQRWSAACSAAIGTQWKDAVIELKLENETQPEGQALFVIIFQEVPIQRHSHNLKGHKIAFHKGVQCIITFGSSGSVTRYNLKFGSEYDAKQFLSMAELLQQVIEYVQNVESICEEASKKAVSKSEALLASISQEATSSSCEDVAQEMATAGPKVVSQEIDLITPEVNASQTLDNIAGMEDAFEKLSLDKVKVPSMYSPGRSDATTRFQYTTQELLDHRGSAEVPPGIRDVQIPLRQELKVKMPSRPQQGHQKTATPSPQVARNTSTFMQDWIAGGSTSQAMTESTQQDALEKDLSADLRASLTSNLIDFSIDREVEIGLNQTNSSDDTIKGTTIGKTEVEDSSRDDSTVVEESLVSWETAKSEHTESAVVVDRSAPASHDQEKTAQATDTTAQSTPVAIPASFLNQAPADRKASVSAATDQSAQTTPVVPAAIGTNPLFAHSTQQFQAPSVHGMPPALGSPQVAYPMGAQPMAYPPQMLQMLPGWQHLPPPPPGRVHAVSVTWHVSSDESPAGEQPSMYNTTTQVNTNGHGPVFSPAARSFQPCQKSQASSADTRPRRGLGSSMHATGYSGAKYAGSFTGGTNFQ